MLFNYFKVSLRNLSKHRGFAVINIVGLATGLACFILIGLFVQYELGFDRNLDNADRVFRVVTEFPDKYVAGSNRWTSTPAPLLTAIADHVPDVEFAAQLAKTESQFRKGNVRLSRAGVFATDDFFKVFPHRFVAGDSRTALEDPLSIVLTQSLATQLFEDSDPVGQAVLVSYSGEHNEGWKGLTVSGVVEDVPANSHLTFDYVVPVMSSPELSAYLDHWDSNNYFTYITLKATATASTVSSRLESIAREQLSRLDAYSQKPTSAPVYRIQPATDIHLRSSINGEFGVNGDIRYVILFSIIAALILFIACINYINLTTARSATRATEVGVRKAMGARRAQLVCQFLGEATIPVVLALVSAVGIVTLLLPWFGLLIGRELTLQSSASLWGLLLLLVVGLGVGVLGGSYPALVLSSFQPIRTLRGRIDRGPGKRTLRSVLVVSQFVVTIVLIIGTIVIQRQLQYIQSANMGVDRNRVVSLEISDQTLFERYGALRQVLESNPNVVAVSAAQTDPTHIDSATPARNWEGSDQGESVTVYRSAVQLGYVDLFGMTVVEGRDFSESVPSDAQEGILINESLKRSLGWDTAVGRRFEFFGRDAQVIGVVKDFNFDSFRSEVAPLALFMDSGWWFPYQRIFVKVRPESMQETVGFLNDTMKEFAPGYPFEYHFLDDAYDNLYKTDLRLGGLLGWFTALALMISCLGLLGLTTFTAQQRTKEIGVRKILGASVTDIVLLLSGDFGRLILLAFVVGAPMGYVIASWWLQEFAFRISVGVGTFVVAGGVVLLVSWLTVSYQSIRVAFASPVVNLRHE